MRTTEDSAVFIEAHYDIKSNMRGKTLHEMLESADVVFLGETHHNASHTEWNGRLVNALFTSETELMIEHEPIGAAGQLVFVNPAIAETAIQWDFTESNTARVFDRLAALSAMIPDDFMQVKMATKQEFLRKGERLIDNYLVHPLSVENVWSLIDHQMARILDEPRGNQGRIELMLKQGYLRTWVAAAFETLDQFFIALEEEVEERNGWMVKKMAKAFHQQKRVLLIAGSDHFLKTISNVKREKVENPILTFLKENRKKYLILVPRNDPAREEVREIVEEFQEITQAETSLLEREALHLCEQLLTHRDLQEELDAKTYEHYRLEMEELKKVCTGVIEASKVETHQKALEAHYMTGAICLRVDKLAKTIQIWNVIAEIALAQGEWFQELLVPEYSPK